MHYRRVVQDERPLFAGLAVLPAGYSTKQGQTTVRVELLLGSPG